MIEIYSDHIFVSQKPSTSKKSYRFENYDELQQKLIDICNNWNEYLKLYIENSHLLFENKMPWEQNERAVVSTLAASIARSCKHALITEEMPVPKPAREKIKNTDKGRCDLWVANLTSENNKPFCFFLEAKFTKPKQIDKVKNYIDGKGIERIFRDYLKSSQGDRLTQNSPYKLKLHHYVISMLTVPFFSANSTDEDLAYIKETLKNVFNKKRSHPIKTKCEKCKARILYRFPTVAFIVNQTTKDIGKKSVKHYGMVTMLTVLAKGYKPARQNVI